MSARVYSVPHQIEGRRKDLLEWKSIELSYELSFTCESNVNIYKSSQHPILARENRGHPGNFQNKSVSSAFKGFSWPNWRGEEDLLWEGRGPHYEIIPKSIWFL